MKLPLYLFSGLFVFLILTMSGCKTADKGTESSDASDEPAVFTLLGADKTKIDFQNIINEGLNTNVLMYEYFYNGGGVAVGDVNNDGLEDIYFTSNMQSNRLYLNKGNMTFEDVTAAAGVSGREGPWKTGVTMADVNGDGLLDIYVCYSGNLSPEKRKNQLFINKGNGQAGVPVFEEKAEAYGLDSPATSTQASFFDYDKDGDLDMFLLNHNPKSLPVLDEATTAEMLKTEDPSNGMRFYRHDKNTNGEPVFKDITRQAGFQSSALSYGLGIGVADLNGDGWQDLYVSNDYTIPDFLYLNDKKGGFINQITKSVGHTSHFSMGSDVSDINNDGFSDVFTLDMLPEDNRRQKLLMSPDNYEKFDFNLKVGFGHQYMRNMLQINQGVDKDDASNTQLRFSEVGQLAGISNTDWSWSALFADYDNDGWKDLFVTNGYLRDYTNLDFLKYMSDFMANNQANIQRQNVLDLVLKIPSSNLTNYVFKNNGNLTFKNVTTNWGISQPANSNGAAYADLDNDGDLDMVVNNINLPAFIYQNDTEKQSKNTYLKVKLSGEKQNKLGIGAKVTLYSGGKLQYLEQMPTRGYQSSVSPVLHFGLGKVITIDSLKVVWLSGKSETIKGIKANQQLTFEEKNAKETAVKPGAVKPFYAKIASPLAYQQTKNTLNDFKRQPLLVNPISFSGPCMVKGDVNGDGLEDVFVGGGFGQTGAVYLQSKSGSFSLKAQPSFEADKESVDTDALFFDANHDGFTDLYVASGGYHNFTPDDARLQDRLYLNDGKGTFTKSPKALPAMLVSKSCVRATDINGDGHQDLFVGGRVIPGRYPESPQSYILINNGKGEFKDETARIAPQLKNAGMITDAAWHDLNNDKKTELILVGEWMPVTVLTLNAGKLSDVTKDYFDKSYKGLYNKLLLEDLNGDGKADLVLGNLGLNAQIKASEKEPAEMIFKDFDDNGAIDPILTFYIQGKSYPYVTRDEMLDQMSIMRTRFPDYKSYADATINDIFTKEELDGSTRLEANFMKTALFISGTNGKFAEVNLPAEAQFSPVFTITSLDYNKDGKKDLLLCGNIDRARLKFGKYDANFGLLLKGDGKGTFTAIPKLESGFSIEGDVRSVIPLGDLLLLGINQKPLQAYKLQ
ncbi:RNA-binding protein [Emticicia sp. CRIBPO]|uniref:VCBS repeat-containing protein n=1 Tax=Emticicia sp. CRIBPO TaxID=2683258 RepID=UPI0014123553|nr:VCBS repeat-containing protein [Emticicia sp. CRIBPO]NBA88767.1 RNA-binding protein [Emticicia sp. CRIBPO]